MTSRINVTQRNKLTGKLMKTTRHPDFSWNPYPQTKPPTRGRYWVSLKRKGRDMESSTVRYWNGRNFELNNEFYGKCVVSSWDVLKSL